MKTFKMKNLKEEREKKKKIRLKKIKVLIPPEGKVQSRNSYWQEVRKLIWDRDEGKCQKCGGEGKDVHHKTYAILGYEKEHLEDLALVCRTCHKNIHAENPYFENSVKIMFDSGKHKDSLNAINFKNLSEGKGTIYIVESSTLWDDLYVLQYAYDVIGQRIKCIKRNNNVGEE